MAPGPILRILRDGTDAAQALFHDVARRIAAKGRP